MGSSTFGPTRLLSRTMVEQHLTTDDALRGVEAVFRAHGEGQVAMPPKITLDLRSFGLEAWHNAMPGYVQPMAAAGIKWAGGYADNPSRFGLPYIMALIVLQDPASGYPLAVMDGTYVTNVRTGASAAICAKYLAKADAGRFAFVGAGAQARFATDALMRTHPSASVVAYDVSEEAAGRYAAYARDQHGLNVEVASSVQDAVSGADVVISVTFADEPLIKGEWLAPGATALSMGSYQEFDDDAVLGSDKIIVDSWDQCAHRGELKRFAESGRLNRSGIAAEMGEVVTGRRPGRENDTQRLFVVPIGLGTHDIALARLVLDRVVEGGFSIPTCDFLNA